MTFQMQVNKKAAGILKDLEYLLVGLPEPIQILAKELSHKSATLYLNASYSGSHSDHGAKDLITNFRQFIAGYNFYDCYNNDADERENPYESMLREISLKDSSEYKQYLELKKKYEK